MGQEKKSSKEKKKKVKRQAEKKKNKLTTMYIRFIVFTVVFPLTCMSVEGSRVTEFASLVHNHSSPCTGPSPGWSCLKMISPEEFKNRNHSEYGFADDTLREFNRSMGATEDNTEWIEEKAKLVPQLTKMGYLKLSMTDRLKNMIYKWYSSRTEADVAPEKEVPMHITNQHEIPMDKLNVKKFNFLTKRIEAEMQEVLEWWTDKSLKHTATYGIRIYKEGNMLLNHFDRYTTHIASVILQIDQNEVQEGWPLEVLLSDSDYRMEVYLQPGEMFLYEGARLKHGRPKRFKGKMFANLFVHYAPTDYRHDEL